MSGPRKVRATNSFCVPILSYGFGLIPWTKQKIAQFDVMTRKQMMAAHNHHPCSAVEHLYLPRTTGGMGCTLATGCFAIRNQYGMPTLKLLQYIEQ